MTLAPGTRIGNYEVLTQQGAGGMGEVYRAHDTRLDRNVAIKSLPLAFAADPGRLTRFEREAKLLASLNHPNIASIYGLEDVSGSPYLVLEFIEGETLAQRLSRGPLTVRETLDVGAQIASAIDAAHLRGIVHRDLKPGNVMMTSSGAVKVLDFGLAKGGDGEHGSTADLASSPTMAISGSAEGVVLGTAPYMSPEQARGKPVDRRADVWAFGCLMYECLSGRQAFDGETVSDVIARVLEREPDWSALPGGTPPRLRDLLQRCLTKEVADRPRDIGDLRGELGAISTQMAISGGKREASDKPSLAVLYFENLSSDSESDYFCAGITEDILTDLSKIKGLRVASRNAVARFRGTAVDLAQVGTELGVRTVLEGSVRRAGDRVRISAQLINAADGFHVWAERYDRKLDDVFAVQEEIAHSIADALKIALSPAESAALARNRPDNVRAYDLYLRGRERYSSYTPESVREALALFQEAARIDPEYALAWAGIADCYGQMLQHEHPGDLAEAERLGLDAARRSIAIDPKLAEGHKAEALVLQFSGDMEGSRAALLRAIDANPRYTPALINLAVDVYYRADLAGTERLLRQAADIDPQDPFTVGWLMQLWKMTSRTQDALDAAHRLRQLSSDSFYMGMIVGTRASIALNTRDFDTVREALRGGETDGAHPTVLLVFRTALAAYSGNLDEARRLLGEVAQANLYGPHVPAMAAAIAMRLGDRDFAKRLMRRRALIRFVETVARVNPELHPLLDLEELQPRRRNVTLVWPLEAPMIDATRHALFREVRIESGMPPASDSGSRA